MIGEGTTTGQIDLRRGDNVKIEVWIGIREVEIGLGEGRRREPVGETTIGTEIHKLGPPGRDHDHRVDVPVPQHEDPGQDPDHHLGEELEPRRGTMSVYLRSVFTSQ